ncbi:MAG: histidinol-phosphatase HisJ family protein [Firmicutes bacterium]|nr:histidinol-phosphatase HisJ family protein [Bacillota bacterium]
MQKYYDYHTHSSISFDSNISIYNTCQLALEKGAAGLTFTEHAMLGNDPAYDELPDQTAYEHELLKARADFPTLELGMGLELDINPQRRKDIEKLLKESAWDFILGSVHELFGCNLSAYDGNFGSRQSIQDAYHNYFCGLYEQVHKFDAFDVLGHLDLIRRNRRFSDTPFSYNDHAEILDALLKLLIQRGQGLEVNTAGWRYGMSETHPSLQVLKRYRELGGEIITCGSDCHSLNSAFGLIRPGYEMIKAAGFEYVSLFTNRKVQQMKLEI